MDRLLDYGDLGAIVKAGFSTPDTCHASFPCVPTRGLFNPASPRSGTDERAPAPSASPASDAGFVALPGALPASFQLPSLSAAFDLLSPLPSPTLLGFPVCGGAVLPDGAAQAVRMPPSSRETLDPCGFYPPVSATYFNSCSPPLSDMARQAAAQANAMVFGQHGEMLSPVCRNGPLAATRSVLGSTHAQFSATRASAQEATGVFPSTVPRIFLRPPVPFADMSTTIAGVEKRSADAEPAMAALASSCSNEARGIKKRKLLQKRVVQVPAMGAVSSKPSAGESVPSDMWAWRKYGQKPIKGSPHPRGYYRCSSSKGCPARKQVERNPNDPSMLIVTYTSDHNHPWPTHRINALAGSTRAAATKSSPNREASPICSGEASPRDASTHSPRSTDMNGGLSPSPLCASPLSVGDGAHTPPRLQDGHCNAGSPMPGSHESGSRLEPASPSDETSCVSSSAERCVWGVGDGDGGVEDREGLLLDSLLSEMLEEVQRQNKGQVDTMMMMAKHEEEDEDDDLFNWSNSFNFLSHVNHHLVQ